jgi:hypothetical protein
MHTNLERKRGIIYEDLSLALRGSYAIRSGAWAGCHGFFEPVRAGRGHPGTGSKNPWHPEPGGFW